MQVCIAQHWKELARNCPAWEDAAASFQQAVRLMAESLSQGGKILLCGNGGSAADAEHIVGELMKSFLRKRPLPEGFLQRAQAQYPLHAQELAALEQGLPAISLVAGVALPTAFANDVNATLLFAQQVYALARPGDVLWAISTSGNSANVNHALRVARLCSCKTLGLSGKDGGEMAGLLDVELRAPSQNTPQVQELHLPMYHALCACLEEIFFGSPSPLEKRI